MTNIFILCSSPGLFAGGVKKIRRVVGYFFDLWNDKNASLILLVNKDMVDEFFLNSFIKYFGKYGVVQDYKTNFKFLDISMLTVSW